MAPRVALQSRCSLAALVSAVTIGLFALCSLARGSDGLADGGWRTQASVASHSSSFISTGARLGLDPWQASRRSIGFAERRTNLVGCRHSVTCGNRGTEPQSKRSFDSADLPAGLSLHNLTRRAFSPLKPGNQEAVGNYVIKLTKKYDIAGALFDRGEEEYLYKVTPRARYGYGIPTTRFYDFTEWAQEGVNSFVSGVDRLGGCTYVCIVSPKGAWLGHFWEDLGWTADTQEVTNKDGEQTTKVITPNQFDTMTLGVFENGYAPPRIKAKMRQISLKQHADQLENAFVFIMHPRFEEDKVVMEGGVPVQRTTFGEGPLYEEELEKLKAEIKRILPSAQFFPEFIYTKPTKEEESDGTVAEYRGRAIFEYDGMLKKNDKKVSKVPMVRLVFENGGYLEDGQTLPVGGPFVFEIHEDGLKDVSPRLPPKVGQSGGQSEQPGDEGGDADNNNDAGEGPSEAGARRSMPR